MLDTFILTFLLPLTWGSKPSPAGVSETCWQNTKAGSPHSPHCPAQEPAGLLGTHGTKAEPLCLSSRPSTLWPWPLHCSRPVLCRPLHPPSAAQAPLTPTPRLVLTLCPLDGMPSALPKAIQCQPSSADVLDPPWAYPAHADLI